MPSVWSLMPWSQGESHLNSGTFKGSFTPLHILMSLIKGVRMGVELVLKVTVIGRPRAGTMDSSPSAPRSWALSAPAPQTASSQLSTWYFCPLSCSTDYFLLLLFFKSPFTSCLPSCPAHSGFPGGSDGEESACNMGDLGLIPGSERSSGGRHGNPL